MVRMSSKSGFSLFAICALTVFSGCFSVPDTPLRRQVAASPVCCRDNIHIVFVDSAVDFASVAGLDQMADSICAAGFRNTHYFNPYSNGGADELSALIYRIRCQDHSARIVVVGWSMATMTVDSALRTLEEKHVVVDSVVHLDSFVLREAKRFSGNNYPGNVRRNVFIYRQLNTPPAGAPNSVVYRVDEPFHMSVPGHCQTYDALLKELLLYRNGNCPCSCHQGAGTAAAGLDVNAENIVR